MRGMTLLQYIILYGMIGHCCWYHCCVSVCWQESQKAHDILSCTFLFAVFLDTQCTLPRKNSSRQLRYLPSQAHVADIWVSRESDKLLHNTLGLSKVMIRIILLCSQCSISEKSAQHTNNVALCFLYIPDTTRAAVAMSLLALSLPLPKIYLL